MIGRSQIRWGRIAVAAVLSEVVVVAVLIAITSAYRFLIAPGRTAAEYDVFADLAGYYIAPAAAGLATLLGALWVGRALTSGFVANGTLVGALAVLLSSGLIFVAKPEDRIMYGVSFALRVLGGYIGGVLAHRSSSLRRLPQPSWAGTRSRT